MAETLDYGAALRDQTGRFAELLDGADLTGRVPTCPDWDLRALVEHLGRAHRYAEDTVRRRVGAPAELRRPAEFEVPGDAKELPGWLVDGAAELAATVERVGADTPVWNFTGRPEEGAGFWIRRMAHETAVHRADVALAVAAPYELAPELAADAISEWLSLVTSPGAAAARPDLVAELRGTGQTLHLHATDQPSLGEAGEWLIRRDPDAVVWSHGHAKGDVAARGLAADLMLVLFNRMPVRDDRIQVFGDTALLEHWCASLAI